MKKYLRNGYFFDPIHQERYLAEAMRPGFKKSLARWRPTIPAAHRVIEKQGLVLTKIPKTGTQTFETLCRMTFLAGETGDAAR